MPIPLAEIKKRAVPVLERHHAIEAYVFGSVARNEAGTGSDIDILVRFDQVRGLFAFIRTKQELESALDGKTVDLVQMEALRPEFQEDIEKERIRIL